MSECCEHCKKPFPHGHNRCNWCDVKPRKALLKKIAFLASFITFKDLLFWLTCALFWFVSLTCFALREEFRQTWESGSISAIFYFLLLLPIAGLWCMVALASLLGSVMLASSFGSGKRWRLLVLFVGGAISFGVGYYPYEMKFHHQADAGNFTWRWRSERREWTGTRLAWKGQEIELCPAGAADCQELSITVVQENPAWLLAVQEEGSKTRVVLLKDGKAQFSSQELGVFKTAEVKVGCWRIDRVFQAPFTDELKYIGDSLWFDPKTEAVLPICALQYDDMYHDGDYTTPVMVSPDRRIIAFADANGLLRLTQVQGMQRFLACYWLSPAVPGERKMRKDGTPEALIDWTRAIRWTENGVEFSPDYRVDLLLAPQNDKLPTMTENERAARCRPPNGEG